MGPRGCERCAGRGWSWHLLTSVLLCRQRGPGAELQLWHCCTLGALHVVDCTALCARTWIQLQPNHWRCRGSVPDHSLRAWAGELPSAPVAVLGGEVQWHFPARTG